jgi:soluble lytic murein transglycosylase
MHTLGLRELALEELNTLRRELEDPLLLYQLALVARDLELYAPSQRAAIKLSLLAPEDTIAAMPLLVQRLTYPAYYPDLVLAESNAYHLDPLLLFALVRQESLFDDRVSSWAGAVGLTQIMPSTGEWIAEMTGWPDYDPELLKRPYLNVKFGAWFLARILAQTEGDVMSALAGYNGGPSLALRWQENAEGDPDLLVEIIGKDESRRYVQSIYRLYSAYARVYGEP